MSGLQLKAEMYQNILVRVAHSAAESRFVDNPSFMVTISLQRMLTLLLYGAFELHLLTCITNITIMNCFFSYWSRYLMSLQICG